MYHGSCPDSDESDVKMHRDLREICIFQSIVFYQIIVTLHEAIQRKHNKILM